MPANRPASSHVIARSARRSGSGFSRASDRPSKNPQTNAAIAKITTRVTLINRALVSHAFIAAPCTNRMKTIRAANTSPRSNHLLMGHHLSE